MISGESGMRARTLCFLAVIIWSALICAAPAPSHKPVAISLKNAEKVALIREITWDAWELVWMPKNQLALHSWEKPVEIVDPISFRTTRKLVEGKQLVHFAASSDGGTIAFCENTNHVEIHNLPTKETLRIDTENPQPSMTFSPNGKLLATGGYGTQAKLWSTKSGKLLRCLDAPGKGGLTTVFSPDGKLLAVGNRNDATRLFDVETGKLLHTLPRKMSHELKFSPNSNKLAVAYVDGSIGLWDVDSGNLLFEHKTKAKEIYTLDWSPAGDVLATAGLEGSITLWDASYLSILKELDAPEWVIRVRFGPDGSRLYSAGGKSSPAVDRKVSVWGLGKR
jgi:WD40 repeat protein